LTVLYRVIHALNAWFTIAMFWCYLVMFLIALPMMFVFPPGTLLLLFIGLASLIFVIPAGRILSFTEHVVARSSLAHHKCPRCQGELLPRSAPDEPWECRSCHARYQPTGELVEGEPAQA